MVRFQKLTRNLFLTLHGHNVHRQQQQLSKFLMRYRQFASHAYCGAAHRKPLPAATPSWKLAPRPHSKHEKRTVGSAWETWTVAAADCVRCARVRWEINFLLTFETAPFFCVYPVFTLSHCESQSGISKTKPFKANTDHTSFQTSAAMYMRSEVVKPGMYYTFFICRHNSVNDLVCARNVVGTLVMPCITAWSMKLCTNLGVSLLFKYIQVVISIYERLLKLYEEFWHPGAPRLVNPFEWPHSMHTFFHCYHGCKDDATHLQHHNWLHRSSKQSYNKTNQMH